MDIEKLIEDTFTAHERIAPDEDAVLAATRARIDRRRSVLTRPLAVAAGVAVLSIAAAAVVVLNRAGSTEDGVAAPDGRVQVSGATAGPAVADLTMPFTLGWLPPGEVEYLVRRINIGGAADTPDTPVYGGEYMLTVTADGQVLNIDVQEVRMSPVDDAAFKSGPGSPVTIAGKRGLESSRSGGPGGYELYVEHPEVGTMYVNVSAKHGTTVPAQQLVDAGRRIAENIRFPGTTTVTPTFGFRELPDGMRICSFDVEKGFRPSPNRLDHTTQYSLGTCDTMPPIHVTTGAEDQVTGTPGERVQGLATRHTDEDGYRRVWLVDAIDGTPIAIAGGVPLAELYDIANRIVLPS